MNPHSLKWSPSLARRLYALLLHLYPSDFRRDYGEELLFLFIDMHRAAHLKGKSAIFRLWAILLIDLVVSAARERSKTVLTQRSANMVSLLLASPFLFLITTAALHYQPPFAAWFTEVDGYTPTLQGRVAMLLLLASVPAALVINLLPRLQKRNAPTTPVTPFFPTPTHVVVGSTVLVVVLLVFAQQLFHELRPFVAPLGAIALVGQLLCLAGVLFLPMVFLLNRLPYPLQAKTAEVVNPPTLSITLIVGATVLLMVVGIVTIFGLETIACASGVPKCD